MHWVYVIACEDDVLYVGETTQLVTRLRAHFKGQGSACTRAHKPEHVAAIYQVGKHASYRDGTNEHINKPTDKPNALWLEQRFVEQLIRLTRHRDTSTYGGEYSVNQRRVMGGSFCSVRKPQKGTPPPSLDETVVFCKCGLPCDVVKDGHRFVHVCGGNHLRWLKRNYPFPTGPTCDVRLEGADACESLCDDSVPATTTTTSCGPLTFWERVSGFVICG